jgi:hypothetical protein
MLRRTDFEGVGVYHYVDGWGEPVAEVGGTSLGDTAIEAASYLDNLLETVSKKRAEGSGCGTAWTMYGFQPVTTQLGCMQKLLLDPNDIWQSEAKRQYAKLSSWDRPKLLDNVASVAKFRAHLDDATVEGVKALMAGVPVITAMPLPKAIAAKPQGPAAVRAAASCPEGTFGIQPNCVPLPTDPTLPCPPGFFGTPPDCSPCPPGQIWNVSTLSCAPVGPPAPATCPPGQMIGEHGTCVSIEPPAPEACPPGQVVGNQGTCVPAFTPRPAPKEETVDYTPWLIVGTLGVLAAGAAVVALRRK